MRVGYRITLEALDPGDDQGLKERLATLDATLKDPRPFDPADATPARYWVAVLEIAPSLPEWQTLSFSFAETVQYAVLDVWAALGDLAPRCQVEVHQCGNSTGDPCSPWEPLIP